MDQKRLTHLRQLEAESIHIIREVAAEFSNPVMMYSIGKDSSVMLHLARKAFYPGTLPFPLLHVDTGGDPARGQPFVPEDKTDQHTEERHIAECGPG